MAYKLMMKSKEESKVHQAHFNPPGNNFSVQKNAYKKNCL